MLQHFDPARVTRLQAKGRFDAGAEKPQTPTISADRVVRCTGDRGSTVAIDLAAAQSNTLPPTAITCVLANGTEVACKGKVEHGGIRIDAEDQENHYGLWFEITWAQ